MQVQKKMEKSYTNRGCAGGALNVNKKGNIYICILTCSGNWSTVDSNVVNSTFQSIGNWYCDCCDTVHNYSRMQYGDSKTFTQLMNSY
jgi:hypothetical protein